MHDRRKYDGLSEADKMDHIIGQQEMILAKQEEILKAFPFGIDHHKQEHIIRETSRKDSEEFIKDLKRTLVKNAIMAFILFILSLVLVGFFTKLAEGLKGVPHVQ